MLLFLLIHTTHSKITSPQTSLQTLRPVNNSREVTLGKGEIQRLTIKGLEKFTIGNNEVLAVKAEGENDLLIRAKSLGHSDLLIWRHGREKSERFHVFVIGKTSQLKLKQLHQYVEDLPVKKYFKGGRLKLIGSIRAKSHYQSLVNLHNLHHEKLNLNELRIDKKLSKEIYTNLLKDFSENNLFGFPCFPEDLFIKCKLSSELSKDLKSFSNKYLIRWQDEKITTATSQYQVSITLQQYENSDGDAFNFGLSKIEGQLGDILLRNPLSLIDENPLTFKNEKFRSETLAHPILKGRLRRPIKIRIGQEIPFLQNVTNGVASQVWKFAGLGIDLKLIPHSQRLLVQYKTNLSRPNDQGISQNLQTSELLVEVGKNVVLFDIGFKVKEKFNQKLPGLSSIPLFGSLFKGKKRQESYKKVLCLIKVEKI